MSIAGIDFSTHAVDVVLLDEDSDAATWHRFELEGQDAFERTRDVRQSLLVPYAGWTDKWDSIIAIGIEDPRGYNAGALYRIQGAILACLPRRLLVQPWIPSAWRKAVGLSGRATKEQVLGWAVARWPDRPSPEAITYDCCDAYAIALATRSLIEVKAA